MNINSNYKDFYDYVVGLVGVDTDRHYYRVAKEWEEYSKKEDLKENNLKIQNLILSYKNNLRFEKPRIGNGFHNPFITERIQAITSSFVTRYGIGVSINTAYIIFGTKVVYGLALSINHDSNSVSSTTYIPIASINSLKNLLSDKSIFSRVAYHDIEEDLNAILTKIDSIRDENIESGLDPLEAAMISSVVDMQVNQKSLANLVDYNKMVGAPVSMFVRNAGNVHYTGGAMGTIILNPMLRGSGVENVIDPMEAYQNIEMAIISINNIEKDTSFSDKVMIESKGFDNKTSFRNRKKKKKDKK